MRKNRNTIIMAALTMVSTCTVCMAGCKATAVETKTVVPTEVIVEEDVSKGFGEAVDILQLRDGQAYNIDEKCNVLENYDEYNIQADVKELYKILMQDNFETIEFRTHSVEVSDDSNNANGKYDVIDKVNVKVTFTDQFGLMPQSVTKEVVMGRDAASGAWEVAKESCKKWDVKHKSLGGTSWKMSTETGDIYFRLRDTIEFFNTQPTNKNSKLGETEFFTTILGAMYMNVDGEDRLRRIHVMSGTLNEKGEIVFRLEFVNEDENMEIHLKDCEKIERDELPFTEEEFRETSDQLG